MAESAKNRSKLVVGSKLDPKDELEERLDACLNIYKNVTKNMSDREASDGVLNYIGKGASQHDEVQYALLYLLLTSPNDAKKCFRDLMVTSKDGLTKLLTITNQIIYEKWSKLADSPRKQVLWLVQELVRSNAVGADSVVHMLLRQMAGGDVSSKNIWLTESLLDVLVEHRLWLEKYPVLMQLSVYSYLRLIIDHTVPNLKDLRQREVEFCTSLLRERWEVCQGIGRDLVRLLQDVARIPEFGPIWRDLLTNPEVLSPNYKGVLQLLHARTSKRFFVVRLTPDMENKLVFLTSKVKFGQQKRYQEWFQKQYLSTPESQTLRCDLIRYICAVIHPSNEILNSDVIPRWAVIGWLLTTCTTNVIASNAKLSLFYDWLFFDTQRDSIMNIEPCVLVMFNSIRPHPAITVTLLDFMCRIMPNFYPPLKDDVKKGIFTSLRTIVDKKVLVSLAPLFDNAKIDRELRAMIKENFSEFCASDLKVEDSTNSGPNKPPVKEDNENVSEENYFTLNNFSQDSAQFSDDEEELTIQIKPTVVKTPEPEKIEAVFRPIKSTPEPHHVTDLTPQVEQLDGPFRKAVLVLQQERESSVERQCELMDRLMDRVLEGDLDPEGASILAQCLVQLLAVNFSGRLFPIQVDEDSLEDSISTPLFVIFRTLCQMSIEDPLRQPVLILLEEMYNKQPKLGYYFLYFLKISKTQTEGKMGPYKELVKTMERSMQECLMNDLRICQQHDVRLYTYLIPDIYNQFSSIAVGHTELLHLIVSCIDSSQLQDLICEILRGHLTMFKKDSFLSVLNASLEWETIEQFFLWQLIAAHSIPVEHLMLIVPKLEYAAHAEALSSIMIQLRLENPAVDLLRPLLCREVKVNDLFTVSVLKFWAQDCEDRLADLLHTFITKPSQVTPNRKRHRHQHYGKSKEKDQPSLDQILAHLEQFRATCRNISFLQNEQIQQALQHVQTTSADSFKSRFSDLLALAEDFDDLPTARVLRSVPSRKASAAAAKLRGPSLTGPDNSESSETSSEDEEIGRRMKKVKRTNVLDDDD